MYPLHPNASAEGMLTFGEAQVIGHAVVFIDTGIRVVARRRGDRRRSGRRRATADDNGARTTTPKKYEILRDRRPETVGCRDRSCIRTNPPQGRGIDDRGGENTRFRQAERLAAYYLEHRIVRVQLRHISLRIA